MKVLVRHGHFAFYPDNKGELTRFELLFGATLVPEKDYFTFEFLKDLPRWSQMGRLYGNLPALITYEAREPYEVMKQNGFVYSLTLNVLTPYATVANTVNLTPTLNYFVAPSPLVQPGSIMLNGLPGNILLGYEADLDLSMQKLCIYSLETLV